MTAPAPTRRRRPRYYAASWTAAAPVCLEESLRVIAFDSETDRDAYVAGGSPGSFYGSADDVGAHVRPWSRESLSRSMAARYLAAIERAAYGGRPSGRAALARL
jgi:hypothetical protein